jgi:tetratricopeptide (TPR) repeat protein
MSEAVRVPRAAAVLALAVAVGGCAAPSKTATQTANAKSPEEADPVFLYQRGRDFGARGDLVRAEQYFAAALAAGGDENTIMPELLRVCVASRHYRLASEYAETALARHPTNARLRFLAGALGVTLGDTVRARERLERAAHELVDNAEIQFAVAVFFRDEMSDRVAADAYFREYLRLAPEGQHAEEARASMMERVQ